MNTSHQVLNREICFLGRPFSRAPIRASESCIEVALVVSAGLSPSPRRAPARLENTVPWNDREIIGIRRAAHAGVRDRFSSLQFAPFETLNAVADECGSLVSVMERLAYGPQPPCAKSVFLADLSVAASRTWEAWAEDANGTSTDPPLASRPLNADPLHPSQASRAFQRGVAGPDVMRSITPSFATAAPLRPPTLEACCCTSCR